MNDHHPTDDIPSEAVKPLGGKHAKGQSSAVAAEVAKLRELGADMRGVGPVNSAERARALRKVLKAHYPKSKDTLDALFPAEKEAVERPVRK